MPPAENPVAPILSESTFSEEAFERRSRTAAFTSSS
jgi:hypothetical protein